MAPMNYLSGKLNPLLALIPLKIREIDFCDCLASDLRWCALLSLIQSLLFRAKELQAPPASE